MKCQFGRAITPEGVTPQKLKNTTFLEKFKFSRSEKYQQRYIGFLNYYKNYIPRLAARLISFFHLFKTTDVKDQISITLELVNDFQSLNNTLDIRCQLAVTQPLPKEQLVLMTDASFQTAGYAVLTENDPNRKYTSRRKTNEPVVYWSKTYVPFQIKMSKYTKAFSAI